MKSPAQTVSEMMMLNDDEQNATCDAVSACLRLARWIAETQPDTLQLLPNRTLEHAEVSLAVVTEWLNAWQKLAIVAKGRVDEALRITNQLQNSMPARDWTNA